MMPVTTITMMIFCSASSSLGSSLPCLAEKKGEGILSLFSLQEHASPAPPAAAVSPKRKHVAAKGDKFSVKFQWGEGGLDD